MSVHPNTMRHTAKRQSLCVQAWKQNIWNRILSGNISLRQLANRNYCAAWYRKTQKLIANGNERRSGELEALAAAHQWAKDELSESNAPVNA